MADTPGFPDCNTCMMIDRHEPAVAVLADDHRQHVGIVPHEPSTARAPTSTGPARRSGTTKALILLKPDDFSADANARARRSWSRSTSSSLTDELREEIRRGTQEAGRQALPAARLAAALQADRPAQRPHPAAALHRHVFDLDHGRSATTTAKPGTPASRCSGFGAIQPAVLRRDNGTLVAYMRENGIAERIRSQRVERRRPDLGPGRRDRPAQSRLRPRRRAAGQRPLAARLQRHDARAATAWPCRSPTTKARPGNGRATWRTSRQAPTTIRRSSKARDGTIHAVYSYFVDGGKSMKHAAFNEAWVRND